MKKPGKSYKELFTKNIDLKILALVIAAVAVMLINMPNV